MSVTRWEPLRELAAAQGEMRRLMADLLGGPDAAVRGERSWLPSVDVVECGGELLVRVDLPGVPEDAIAVELDDDTLVVRGERREEHEEHEDRFYRRERRVGTFERSIPLPHGVDERRIAASYADGVLEVRVPKPEERRARRIEIEQR